LFQCAVPDTTVSASSMSTDKAVVRSGWIMSSVLAVKEALRSVDMQDGDQPTVVTTRMSQYPVLLNSLCNTQVTHYCGSVAFVSCLIFLCLQ